MSSHSSLFMTTSTPLCSGACQVLLSEILARFSGQDSEPRTFCMGREASKSSLGHFLEFQLCIPYCRLPPMAIRNRGPIRPTNRGPLLKAYLLALVSVSWVPTILVINRISNPSLAIHNLAVFPELHVCRHSSLYCQSHRRLRSTLYD